MNSAIPNQVAPLYTHAGTFQPVNPTVSVPVRQFTGAGTLITTLTIASALAIGSNMVAVKNGDMTVSQAVLNATVKGAAATVILKATAQSTALQVITVAGVLVGAGFLIELALEKEKKHPPGISGIPG